MLETETEVDAQVLLDRLTFLAYVPFGLNLDEVCRTCVVCNHFREANGRRTVSSFSDPGGNGFFKQLNIKKCN